MKEELLKLWREYNMWLYEGDEDITCDFERDSIFDFMNWLNCYHS